MPGLVWRPTLLVICTLLMLFTGSVAHAETPPGDVVQNPRPNILLIVAEDMSGRVNAFGDALAKTPAIDALASEGVRYANVFTTSGVCAPSRSSLITGVYQTSMGTHQMRTSNAARLKGPAPNYDAVPPVTVKAFPELLRKAGYATANMTKLDYQFGEPFTVWDLHLGGYGSAPDLALWRKLPQGKPFFVMLNLMSTHESRLFPVGYKSETAFGPAMANLAARREKIVTAVTDPAGVEVPPYYPDTPEVRASIARHYDNIHYMDSQVQQTLANLEADGLGENTIVIWTTDHGDGLPRAKRGVYDSGIKVPLIIRYPDRLDKGTARDDIVSFVDLAPALLQLAGVTPPEFIQGRDFLNKPGREYVCAARDRMDRVPDRVRAVRDGRYKFIRNYRAELSYFRPLAFRDMFPIMRALWAGHTDGTLTPLQELYFTVPRPIEELYDTVLDPHEVNNLATDIHHKQTLVRLRAAMDEWIARVGDKGEMSEENMVLQMWPDYKQPVTGAPKFTMNLSNGEQMVSLDSATKGASIGYRFLDDQEDAGWQLYSTPIQIPAAARLEAKAIRYGFAESPVTVFPQAPESSGGP